MWLMVVHICFKFMCVKVRDIVFIHNNLRLKDKIEDINYCEEHIQWAMSSDEDGSCDDEGTE